MANSQSSKIIPFGISSLYRETSKAPTKEKNGKEAKKQKKKGTDITNEIEAQSDFKIDGAPMSWYKHCYNEFSPVSEEIREKILSITGVKKDSVQMVTGSYIVIDDHEEYRKPFLEAEQDEIDRLPTISENLQPQSPNIATVQVVNDSYINELQQYVQKNNLKVDIDSLKNGTGVVFLHYHQLSPTLMKKSRQTSRTACHFLETSLTIRSITVYRIRRYRRNFKKYKLRTYNF